MKHRAIANICLTAGLLLLGACAGNEQRRYNADWPMFQNDPARRGYVDDAPRPPLKLRWSFATEGRIISAPSVLDGTVYFGSRDSRFYALGLQDGAKRWDIELEQGGIFGSPTVTPGAIFAGKAEAFYYLYAWSRTNGDTLWSRESGELVNRPPWTLTDATRLYTHLDPELNAPEEVKVRMAALDPATGQNLWTTPITGIPTVAPSLSGPALLVASNDQKLRSLDAATGAIQWEADLGGDPASSPLIHAGRAIVSTREGFVSAYELSTGKVAWRYQFPNTEFLGNLALSGKLLLIPGARVLKSFDISALEPRWTFRAPADVTAPAVSREHAYIGSANGMIYVVRLENGSSAWLYRTGGEILASPVLAGGLVLVGSSDGKMYAFEEQPVAEQPRTQQPPKQKPAWMQNR